MLFPENFSDEIFLLVFYYLDTADLVQIGLVSKKWRQLSKDQKFCEKFLKSKTNYLPSKTPRLWRTRGKLENSYFRILCDTKFLYFLDLLNSLKPTELFYYVTKLLAIWPHLEDTVREERLEMIVATPTFLQKLASLNANEMIENIKPLLRPMQNNWPHRRAKKFIEAMLTVTEFSQKISGNLAKELARFGISPKFLLKENKERFTSDNIYGILKYYSEESRDPLVVEQVLDLLEDPIIFKKLGSEGFLNIVVTSIFAEPLLKKLHLIQKLSCEDILRIMEIMFDIADEGIGNLDLMPPDLIIESNEIFQKYKTILNERTDITEEIAKRVTALN